jgi:PAS domain S-box-containing protein
MTDRDGRYLYHNTEAERVIGRSDAELRGKTTWDVNEPEAAAEITAMDRQVLESGQPLIAERSAPGGAGYEWSMAIKFPIRNGDGEIVGIGGFDIDTGQSKQAEKALRESSAMLQRAQKMESVGQLTAGIAHDFNNMLTVVIGTLEMTEERAEPVLRPSIGSALQAAEHGAELVRRLLAFSRRQPLNPSDLDVNELVRDVEPLLRRALGEDVEIELKLAPDLGASRADGAQVESALMNLAVNARDAMAEGGKLTIETSNQDLDEDYARANIEVTPGGYVMLAVTDTGTGMPQEVAARAVEPFFTTKEFGKGSGLGLSMIYGFAKQSGGHMKIYSELDHGTQVRLYLPRVDGGAVQARPDRRNLDRDLRGSETILVVEDNQPVRDFVVAQLRDLGYHVIEAANGPEAQGVLAGDIKIDLLFTDVIMPGGMTGRQLSDAARRRRPALKTLFTSGYTENSIVHQGKLDPGIHFLPKPHKRNELAIKVREVLDEKA